MPLLSEIIVQELLKESNTYSNKYALSVKIAGKDLNSASLTADEKVEVNRILQNNKISIVLV